MNKWLNEKGKKKGRKGRKRRREEVILYQDMVEEVTVELSPCLIKQQILTLYQTNF